MNWSEIDKYEKEYVGVNRSSEYDDDLKMNVFLYPLVFSTMFNAK